MKDCICSASCGSAPSGTKSTPTGGKGVGVSVGVAVGVGVSVGVVVAVDVGSNPGIPPEHAIKETNRTKRNAISKNRKCCNNIILLKQKNYYVSR